MFALLRFGCIAWTLVLVAGNVAAGELSYVKKDTRRLTREASLEVSRPIKMSERWWVIGPFPNEFRRPFPPEEAIDLKAEYEGAGETARWQDVRFPDGRVNSLRRFKRNDDVLCYLYRKIEVAEPTQVRVSLGSNKGMALWLNGEQLLFTTEERIATMPNQDFVTLQLKPGANDLLLKLPNKGRGGWSFYFEPTIENRLLTKLDRQLERDFPSGNESAYYRIEPLPLPDDEVIEVGAMAFRPDGKLYVATRRGDIWLVSNPTSENVDDIQFTPFARGLHEVLGLCVVGEDLYCTQRPEVTVLRDTNGDDQADEFTTFSDAFGVSGDYHEYLYGPARDRNGDMFITLNLSLGGGTGAKAAYRGLALKVLPDGSTVPWATGLRSPNGVNFSPDGRLFCTDNQGEWVATCKLQEIRQGEFYGHRGALKYWPGYVEGQYPEVIPPAVWLPFGLSRSASEPVWNTTGGRFGPFEGQCFVGELTNSAITRVALEEVNGRMQGVCFPFRKGFSSGVNRLAFAPDGSLFVGETNRGWGSLGGQIQGVERLVYSGKPMFEVQSMNVTPQGWDLKFTQPIDVERANDLKNWLVESYTYHYWDTYGSPEIERKQHKFSLEVSPDDPHIVKLSLEERPLGKVFHVRMKGLRSQAGESLLNSDAYYTLNAIPN